MHSWNATGRIKRVRIHATVAIPSPGHEQAERISTLLQLFLFCFRALNSWEQLRSLFNLGRTDGDSVCGDCINISNPDEGGGFGGRTDESLLKGRAKKEETKGQYTKAWSSQMFSSLRHLISFLSLPLISFSLSLYHFPLPPVCLLLKVATGRWEAAMWWQHNRWESRRWEAGFKFSPDRTRNTLEYQQPCVLTHTGAQAVQCALELQIRRLQVRVDKFENGLELWTCACIASFFLEKIP